MITVYEVWACQGGTGEVFDKVIRWKTFLKRKDAESYAKGRGAAGQSDGEIQEVIVLESLDEINRAIWEERKIKALAKLDEIDKRALGLIGEEEFKARKEIKN